MGSNDDPHLGRVMLAGARVRLMGRTIERRAVRHFLGRVYEIPLDTWRDVAGSKISYPYFVWAAFDLLLLRLRYRK